jgi:integrase
MARGSAVVLYRGKRGDVWRIKYTDASGKQHMETLGPASEGWNRKRARLELRAREDAVAREGYRKPERVTFESFALQWVEQYASAKDLKKSTGDGYRSILRTHLIPAFRTKQLGEITVERIEHYLAEKRKHVDGSTTNRHLNVLSLIFKAALRRGLVQVNPVPLVDRPREGRRRWRILSPAEVGRVERAFNDLMAAENDKEQLRDLETARVLFITLMGTGVRRGEALGLRWRALLLADPDGPVMRVEETWVRSRIDTPKSAAGHRTIALGARVADELFQHRARTRFSGDDERVFVNPRTGNPFRTYDALLRTALLRAGIADRIRPCHDLRHSSITNAAAAGTPPEPLMTRSGHSSYSTTRRYIDLAGERFREEAERLERRLWSAEGVEDSGRKPPPSTPESEASGAEKRL